LSAPVWLWIPLTVWAGFAQTLRNAAQRHLVAEAGTLGATLVRFLYGLPFALVWLGLVLVIDGSSPPSPNAAFFAWVLEGGLCQILATALLLRVMAERNFAMGVAYSKTELVQVTAFAAVFLSDPVSAATVLAVGLATLGVLMLSPIQADRPLRSLLTGWTSRTALLGFASGAGFALAAVGYRGASLELAPSSFTLAAAYSLVWAQTVQVATLGGWLLLRNARVLGVLLKLWRPSLFAGLMGTAASAGWFTAMAIEPVAHVRTLGLVELLFSFGVAHRFFRERLTPAEIAGVCLLTLGLVVITLGSNR
jgi:drug/metabolite transporter (DMT)-like permease